MTYMTRPVTLISTLLAAAALAVVLLTAAPAGAIVPPKNCGKLTVKGKSYNIKADQLKCTRARDYSEDYLRSHDKPRYYKCYNYSGSAIKFRCVAAKYNPDKTFWAIKR
jgi:hypothetical protein